jgi:hypothetical protein
VRLINRIVQFLNSMGAISASERQRLVRELPELSNCVHQTVESNLTILHSFSHPVFNDPSLKVKSSSLLAVEARRLPHL